jgi:hypothetical protein
MIRKIENRFSDKIMLKIQKARSKPAGLRPRRTALEPAHGTSMLNRPLK